MAAVGHDPLDIGEAVLDRPQFDTNDDTRRLTQEVRDLKERIQVLERVITDNRSTSDLDREIERLRNR